MAKIRFENYSKTIRGIPILIDINLEFDSGNIYGLKGKNGSGKTMLMRAISGLILPSKGSVFIDDKEIGKDISFPPNIGVLIENPAFISNYTGKKNLKLLASIQNKVNEIEIAETLEKVGLNPNDTRTYRKYSLGMKQRLGIAAAILGLPDIVILDEPINALDESGAKMIRELLIELKNKGSLIIIACHDTAELKFLSDIIYTISDGKIIKEVIDE